MAVDLVEPRTLRQAAPRADAPRPWPRLSCVLPCRNEAANLAELLPQLATELARCSAGWEVIVVDDGSTDSTPLLLAAWTQRAGFRAVQLSRNFGKEAALTAGLEAAAGDVVVTMDADLQHPAALLPAFVQLWREGADVAYAVREHRRDESAFKRHAVRAFYRLVNAGDRVAVPPGAGDFRLMDRSVVNALLALPERTRFMKGLYAWVGFDAVPVPYQPPPRRHGRSHFTPLKLLRLSLAGITAFTTWPLRAVSLLGIGLALPALGYGAWLTLSYLLWGHRISGWTTLAVGMLGFAGIQLACLGVVGEYVGRIFEETKARPLYVVRRESGRGLAP